MEPRFYKLKNTITGKFVKTFDRFYGYDKNGKLRSRRLSGESFDNSFLAVIYDDIGCYFTSHNLEYHIQRYIVEPSLVSELDNLEIVAYEYTETRTTLKLKNLRTRLEKQIIINKLSI